ncbi:MAG: hypothetical protein HWE15_04960 [Algoriphagus sp.]|uniref:hypothetical protein n=1 Tax=Algoriphagus sp. TaxID=1872435 RepID=UPI00183614AD|nr:hypothetical protein [Algoriphagus sp.]NVJ85632.1 hypothetical protein [Algoriphagus sp.]
MESTSQQTHIELGFRSQKSFGLYFENGIVTQFSFEKFVPQRFYLGAGYITSRIGSALGTNAIKQDNFQIWLSYYLMKGKKFRPFISVGSGFFSADYESDVFRQLDHQSALISTNAGLEWASPFQLKINLALGYNFISGNGEKGPGTLYPTFAQLNLFYPLK